MAKPRRIKVRRWWFRSIFQDGAFYSKERFFFHRLCGPEQDLKIFRKYVSKLRTSFDSFCAGLMFNSNRKPLRITGCATALGASAFALGGTTCGALSIARDQRNQQLKRKLSTPSKTWDICRSIQESITSCPGISAWNTGIYIIMCLCMLVHGGRV